MYINPTQNTNVAAFVFDKHYHHIYDLLAVGEFEDEIHERW